MSEVNYRLELPVQWSIHPVFHIDLLTPYHETSLHGANYQRPPPDLIKGEEEYKVEKILSSRHFGRGRKLQCTCYESKTRSALLERLRV